MTNFAQGTEVYTRSHRGEYKGPFTVARTGKTFVAVDCGGYAGEVKFGWDGVEKGTRFAHQHSTLVSVEEGVAAMQAQKEEDARLLAHRNMKKALDANICFAGVLAWGSMSGVKKDAVAAAMDALTAALNTK